MARSVNPAGRPRVHVHAIALQPKGQVQMNFSGPPGAIHILLLIESFSFSFAVARVVRFVAGQFCLVRLSLLRFAP